MAAALSGKYVSLAALWTVVSAVVAGAAYHRGLNHGASKSAWVGHGMGARRRRDAACGEGGEGGDETRFAENDEDIERVLSFWFDGSTRDNHRTKWFAQGENVPRIDAVIREKFGKLVLRAEAGELTQSWSGNPRSIMALILLLDQFSRNMFREDADRDARVEACDRQALPLAEALLERGWQRQLSVEQHVFALMPLRHTPSKERLRRVMEEASESQTRLEHSMELLQRFKKATNRRLQGMEDKAEEGAEILEHFEFQPENESDMDRHQLVKVLRVFLDERGGVAKEPATRKTPSGYHQSSKSSPTAAVPTSSDSATTRASKIQTHQALRKDIQVSSDAETTTSSSNNNNNNDDDDSDSTTKPSAPPTSALRTVAVSLSGGVDSMALCRALVHLRPMYGFEVLGIHIDYGNRHESGREADFVEGWCARHGVIFYKRTIAEVRRGVTARDEYEKVAREIRFNAYKDALAGRGDGCPAVMFGHHEGDVEENVLTNLVKGCSILGLAGMLPENTVNGVRVWRPMLPFNKDVVFDFAHKFGVPYFKDTTPSWSTRGKLRRQLVPMMEDVFGSGFLSHLSAVARESDDLRELVHRELFRPVWDKAEMLPLGLRLELEPYRSHGLLFWKEILRHLVHAMGMPMVRDKTLGMFVRDVLQRDGGVFPLREGWVELRKEYAGLLSKGSIYIFRTGVFLPPNTSYGEQAEGTPVPLDGGRVDVGPWRIETVEGERKTAEELQEFARGRPPAMNKRPFETVDELMKGELTYVVGVPNTPDAALTVQAGDRAKAPAWTDVDSRIRRALPLVAPPPSHSAPTLVEAGSRMITVTLKYMGTPVVALTEGGGGSLEEGGQALGGLGLSQPL